MIGMNPNIQSVERDENGVIKDVIMNILEKTESDGLRSRVISEMCTFKNFCHQATRSANKPGLIEVVALPLSPIAG